MFSYKCANCYIIICGTNNILRNQLIQIVDIINLEFNNSKLVTIYFLIFESNTVYELELGTLELGTYDPIIEALISFDNN